MAVKLRYIGTELRWPELEITGFQNTWYPGQIGIVDSDDAIALLDTGFFERVDAEPVSFPVYTVATLPDAELSYGSRVLVSDADTPVFGETVTGGDTSMVPVFSNGTAWVVG